MHTITTYLGKRDVSYETVAHRHTLTANQTAYVSHVPRRSMAKGVLFCAEDSYVLAVVPASSRVDAQALARLSGSAGLELASEDELANLFPDCETGAVPAVGAAYGIQSVIDAALLDETDIYLEAGDHQHLVRVSGADFRRLMADVSNGPITVLA
ncbi:MAG: YbaK/prolyl-tRNA synthetase associated protein [Myxococcaceae bacterium]|nr:YbaK/prolyl-tRNA synthetase associated protein [Myxococcaceae bacterium]